MVLLSSYDFPESSVVSIRSTSMGYRRASRAKPPKRFGGLEADLGSGRGWNGRLLTTPGFFLGSFFRGFFPPQCYCPGYIQKCSHLPRAIPVTTRLLVSVADRLLQSGQSWFPDCLLPRLRCVRVATCRFSILTMVRIVNISEAHVHLHYSLRKFRDQLGKTYEKKATNGLVRL